MSDKPKSRAIAAVLNVVAPGIGHAFVGHPLRGVVWALLPFVVFTIYRIAAHEPSILNTLVAFMVGMLAAYLGSIVDVLVMPVSRHRPTSTVAIVAFVVAPIIVAPVFAMIVRVFVAEAFKVPSGAMIPTIAVGDHLFVDKSVYRSRLPRRGEVFVFKYPEHPEQDFVKRAIATSGDKLEVRAGHPVINGWEVPFCVIGNYHYLDGFDGAGHDGELDVEFLEGSAYLVFLDKNGFETDYQGPFYAKPGETWVLGDNRNNSHDSRMWWGGQGGGVPRENVLGRARLIWLSENHTHQGNDLADDPVAPTSELQAPLAACLAKRPSLEKSTPPQPAAQ